MEIYNSKPPKYELTYKQNEDVVFKQNEDVVFKQNEDVVTKFKTTIHNHTTDIHNQYEKKISELKIKRDIILEDTRQSYINQINTLIKERDEEINQYIYQIDKQIEYISVDNSRPNTISLLLYIQNIFSYNNSL